MKRNLGILVFLFGLVHGAIGFAADGTPANSNSNPSTQPLHVILDFVDGGDGDHPPDMCGLLKGLQADKEKKDAEIRSKIGSLRMPELPAANGSFPADIPPVGSTSGGAS